MSETIRIGRSKIVDVDRGFAGAQLRLLALKDQWIRVGIPARAVNAYGESIPRYGYAQAATAAHSGWAKAAKAAVNATAAQLMPNVQRAAVDGPSVAPAIDSIGAELESQFRSRVESADMVDSGALRDAVGYSSPTHPERRSWSVTRTRIKRAGGFGALSEKQQLYQLYHRGRTRAHRERRKAVSYAEFKSRFASSYTGKRGQLAAMRGAMSRSMRAAQRVARLLGGGRAYNSARASIIRAQVLR